MHCKMAYICICAKKRFLFIPLKYRTNEGCSFRREWTKSILFDLFDKLRLVLFSVVSPNLTLAPIIAIKADKSISKLTTRVFFPSYSAYCLKTLNRLTKNHRPTGPDCWYNCKTQLHATCVHWERCSLFNLHLGF